MPDIKLFYRGDLMWDGLIVKHTNVEMIPQFSAIALIPHPQSCLADHFLDSLDALPSTYVLKWGFLFFFFFFLLHQYTIFHHLFIIQKYVAISCQLTIPLHFSSFLLVQLYLFLKIHFYFNFTSGE